MFGENSPGHYIMLFEEINFKYMPCSAVSQNLFFFSSSDFHPASSLVLSRCEKHYLTFAIWICLLVFAFKTDH